ncbi:hypothetical protein NBO_491g0002 [Nosema bombycis CQ1]|uniref:Uncharacterized protein n=1 Tax=Nosema bombycis (strain CQ1 / CVCC 102059) TaxID=578461 RepID=R0MDT2_NOSB1|nr:hypothetical protein NBO_491g0002 [Nosema bombycis CQ1]|eukprot:EOB12240.1 hypothetical protein NBO_491g0002 [Nosema bombycis CQ1]
MNNKNIKLESKTEETIIRGMKLNIENKRASTAIKTPTKKISRPFINMESKDEIFYNKHMVSDKLQTLVAQGIAQKKHVEGGPRFERMFTFDDIKNKWKNLEGGNKM